MKKGQKILYTILQWTWCLPQNLLGLFLLPFSVSEGKPLENAVWRYWKPKGGISLGSFVYISSYLDQGKEQEVLRHEYGHVLQSLYLGPFYLLAIGLPSFLWATLFTLFPGMRKHDYYAFYTEAWANRLTKKHQTPSA